MNQQTMGCISLLIGVTLSSIELYCLKFVDLAQKASGFAWPDSPLGYVGEPNIALAFLLNLLLILFGASLFYMGSRNRR